MRRYQKTEYDIIFTVRGKKQRIYAGSPFWYAAIVCQLLLLIAGLLAFPIWMILLGGLI